VTSSAPATVQTVPTPIRRAVMLVVPDVSAAQRLACTLAYLSLRKHRVHLGVFEDRPNHPDPMSFGARYPGLTASRLPVVVDDWSTLRTLVRRRLHRTSGEADRPPFEHRLRRIEASIPVPDAVRDAIAARRPDVLVVGRLRDAAHVDYLRAARELGVSSIYVTLDADDVKRGDLTLSLPDAIAVWNREQRREAVDLGIPIRRTCITGAQLATDVLESVTPETRASFAARVGVPVDGPIALCLPDPHAKSCAWVGTWLREHAAPESTAPGSTRAAESSSGTTSRVTPLIFATSTSLTDAVASSAGPAATVLTRTGDEYLVARELNAALAHASVVITDSPQLAIEAMSRTVPVVMVPPDGDEQAGTRTRSEGERLARAVARDGAWPVLARTAVEQADAVVRALDASPEALVACRAFVRIHGAGLQPGYLLGARMVEEVPAVVATGPAPHRDPSLVARAMDALVPVHRASRQAAERHLTVLLALPSPEALERWGALLDAIRERGHRSIVVFAPDDGAAADGAGAPDVEGVLLAGTAAGVTRWPTLTRGVAAVRMVAPALVPSRGTAVDRWRRRIDLEAPAWSRELQRFEGRTNVVARAARLAQQVDRHLPIPRRDWRLVHGHAPDVVLALPALESPTAARTWAALGGIVRASRAAGIPVVEGVFGAGSVEELLAEASLRPHGINFANAQAIVAGLEARAREQKSLAGYRPAAWRALVAGGVLRLLPFSVRVTDAVRTRLGSGAAAAARRSKERTS